MNMMPGMPKRGPPMRPPAAEPDEPEEMAIPTVSLGETLTATWDTAQAWATMGVLFLGMPAMLYIISVRRGLSTRELLQGLVRLPFSDSV